jgi:rare lipoprotein A (peptidoglycan hydrolase)
MRKRLLIPLAALAWPLITFLFSMGLQAPLIAHTAQTIKPIRVWSGIVSWYGPQFDGRATASGEPFDMFSLPAAHPTLPFGSMVRLVNVKNGRSQVVRINDRGPYVEGREIDVSFLVASRLGLLDKGIDRVRIELLAEPQPQQHQP